MIPDSIGELADITHGALALGTLPPLGGRYEPLQRVVFDSRELHTGDVYWNLAPTGAKWDGRGDQAFAAGALGVVAAGRTVEPWAGRFSLRVHDASDALRQLGVWARRRFSGTTLLLDSEADSRHAAGIMARLLGQQPGSHVRTWAATNLLTAAGGWLDVPEDCTHAVVRVTRECHHLFHEISALCEPDLAVIYSPARHGEDRNPWYNLAKALPSVLDLRESDATLPPGLERFAC